MIIEYSKTQQQADVSNSENMFDFCKITNNLTVQKHYGKCTSK